ncbi:sterol desaturase family protein [Phenylobacterium sp.]|uniref:sterol desaturase family protein n=1 Tax=Phenylobacterium sp. TaxID=1871053 RepID=UPI002DEECC4B|nr:sterol desaturase family protein [Phenylobacterium sp.]
MPSLVHFLADDARGLWQSLVALAFGGVFFAGLARLAKPRTWVADGRAALPETRVNAVLSVVDQLTVTPAVAVFIAWMGTRLREHGLQLAAPEIWASIGPAPTFLVTVFTGDFIGYWRHRAQHSKWLWPAHAIHHSDTRLTWFSLERMHPIDRLGSALDTVILAALGFPFWAQAGNVFVRHYYGYFIHADVPWTYGRGSWVFNTPVMHRWHHARDVAGSGSNFATVFSVFDRAFGTFHQPGPCDVALGVREDMGRGAMGQYLHPFRAWRAAIRSARATAILPAE